MKRLLELKTLVALLLVVAMSSVFVACGDDDDTPTPPITIDKELFIGKKWDVVKIVANGKEETEEPRCTEKQDYIQFRADGKMLQIIYDSDCVGDKDSGTKWELSSDTLTTTYGKSKIRKHYTIKKLTSTELVVEFFKYTEDGKEKIWGDKNKDGKQDKSIIYYKSVTPDSYEGLFIYSKWELSGNTLIFIYENDHNRKDYYTIKKITSSELVLELFKRTKNGKEVLIDENKDEKQDKTIFYYKGVDDTLTTTNKELLIEKKWEAVKLVVDDEEIAPRFDCAEKHGYTLYKADGKAVDISYDSDCKEKINKDDKWELSGNTLILIFEENTSEEYSADGELISKKTIIAKLYFTIKALTSSELVMELSKKTEDGKEVLIDRNEDGKQDKTIAYYKGIE